ncbi:TetR/AcrR family transcriptional regulator [Microbacterium protaetiae]|uniref:TetR/AcrR family transcriptional regulator n=1 Tax=Microbacterium protaetiae TaxID=2509458 RepID=A0A4V0YDB6_9MICO|nr:TetR/AcrR family transcriptional regulator [Microbacterium protaetiae]QAY60141.1 TetR/AcrR family transcriptional regulator [Microbacterium protaetiae]
MAVTAREKTVREGQPGKRAAILTAARELFLRDGFERTSMDAVAAQAKVSKRTVYDYYGDKERLRVEVIDDAGESLLRSLKRALAKHLSDEAPISTADVLEQALLAFSLEIGTTIIGSTDYATVFALSGKQRAEQPELMSRQLSTAPEDAVAERLAHFHEVGILDAPDARTAADHFSALTLLLAYNNQPDPAGVDPADVRRTMTAGVHAFMRAYARRS